jgi:hypothetical protein
MVIVEDLKKSDISSSVYGGVVCDIISISLILNCLIFLLFVEVVIV